MIKAVVLTSFNDSVFTTFKPRTILCHSRFEVVNVDWGYSNSSSGVMKPQRHGTDWEWLHHVI
jgi:hypothetical protein